MLSAKWRPSCLSLNMLTLWIDSCYEWVVEKNNSKKYCYGLDSDLPNVDFLLLQGKIIMTWYYIKGSNWQFANVENWSYFEQSSHIYPSWPTECLLWENWPSYKSTTLYQHCINITGSLTILIVYDHRGLNQSLFFDNDFTEDGKISPCICRADSRCVRPANERRRYFVMTSLIGWSQA